MGWLGARLATRAADRGVGFSAVGRRLPSDVKTVAEAIEAGPGD
jgi:hypothetical protein